MNDTHEGPAPPGGIVFHSTRYTTFVSMSTPNVCEMIRAIRGQPNRGWRDLSSPMVWIRAALGLCGAGFFGHWLDENSPRYVRRTHA
jgi:hypothetical protein